MRSIICISLMLAATALSANDGPKLGCYLRVYTDGHLARHPTQIVEAMRLKIYEQPDYGEIVGEMRVLFADQGRLRGSKYAGAVMDQFLICWSSDQRDEVGCSVECDGGSFRVVKQTLEAMTFETNGLWVGDTEGCGGAETIAEVPGQSVRYRLNRVDASICEGK